MGDSNELPKITSPDEIRTLYSHIIGIKKPTSGQMLDCIPDLYRSGLYTAVAQDGYEKHAWQFREAYRMRQKIYAPISFSAKTPAEQQLIQFMNVKREHFVHLSKDAPGYIAYTPDEASGLLDRRVKTTVGRYLKKHFDLDDAKIRELTDAFRNRYGVEDVKFARTEEETVRVYLKGPNSCMSSPFDTSSSSKERYGSHKHPAAVYASPNVAVAYLERNGKINSRAVIYDNPENPNDKRFIRVYGDEVLRLKLESMGYKQGTLEGVPLRKIVGRRTDNIMLPNTYLMPFIDDMVTSSACIACVKEDCIVITDGKNKKAQYKYFTCRSQSGLIGEHYEYRRIHGANWNVGRDPKLLDSSDSGTELSKKPLDQCECADCKSKTKLLFSTTLGKHICEECVKHSGKYKVVYVGADTTDVVNIDAATIDIKGLKHPVLKSSSVIEAVGARKLSTRYYSNDTYALRDDLTVTSGGSTILIADMVIDVTGRTLHIDDVYSVGKQYVNKKTAPTAVVGLGVNTNTQQLEMNMNPAQDDLHWKSMAQLFDELSINIKPRMRKKALTAHLLNGDMNAIDIIWDYYKDYLAKNHPTLVNKVAQGVLIDESTEVEEVNG
jgi:hypothetical protein